MPSLPARPFPGVQDELEALSLRVQEAIAETVPSVQDLGDAVLSGQLRMLRPGLLLTVARALGPLDERALGLAEMLELIHLASLLHEKGAALPDLGEEAVWNQKKAILLGDLLLSRAMTLLGRWGDPDVVARVATVTGSLAEGQLLEIHLREEESGSSPEVWVEALETCKEHRLGTFLAQAATLGAQSSRAPTGTLPHLDALGRSAGCLDALVAELESGGEDWPGNPGTLRSALSTRASARLDRAREALEELRGADPELSWDPLADWLDQLARRLVPDRDPEPAPEETP